MALVKSLVTCPCAFGLRRLAQNGLGVLCALICVLSYVCSPKCLCAHMCVLSYVLLCALIWVLSSVCSSMCSLTCVLSRYCVLFPLPPITLFGVSCRDNIFVSQGSFNHILNWWLLIHTHIYIYIYISIYLISYTYIDIDIYIYMYLHTLHMCNLQFIKTSHEC